MDEFQLELENRIKNLSSCYGSAADEPGPALY